MRFVAFDYAFAKMPLHLLYVTVERTTFIMIFVSNENDSPAHDHC